MGKKVLGKGMDSLLKETPNQILAKSLGTKKEEEKIISREVPIGDIRPNPNQPRKSFHEKELNELAQSIKKLGVLEPLLVTKKNDGFELIAGERRLRAAGKANLKKVPVIIKNDITEMDQMVISIVENIQRSDLNCIEEALAYSSLMDEFQLTQEAVAQAVGKERSTVANYLRILKLPRVVIDFIREEKLSFGHAKVLASSNDEALVVSMAKETVEKGLNVRELEKLIKSVTRPSRTRKDDEDSVENKFAQFRDKLEQRTGFHCNVKSKGQSGYIALNFSGESEFNDIYDFLMKQ